jgi:hypothetical protein
VDQILGRSKQGEGNQRKGCNSFEITPKGREKDLQILPFAGLLSSCFRVFRVWK